MSVSGVVLEAARDESLADGRPVPELLDEAFDFIAGGVA